MIQTQASTNFEISVIVFDADFQFTVVREESAANREKEYRILFDGTQYGTLTRGDHKWNWISGTLPDAFAFEIGSKIDKYYC